MTESILEMTRALNSQAVQAWQNRDRNQAEELLKRALQIILPHAPESLEAAKSLHCMGIVIYDRGGDYTRAEQSVQRALAIREEQSPDSLDTAESLNVLGVIAADQGDSITALNYFTRSLAIREKVTPESPKRAVEIDKALAIGYNNLGGLAYRCRDLPQALDNFARGLLLRERLDPQSLEVADSLSNIGITYLDMKQTTQAQDYLTRACAIREWRVPGQLAHAISLYNLGLVAQAEGRIDEAEALHTQALAIRERLTPHSLDLADSLASLGQIAFHRRQYPLAIERFEQAVAIIEELRAQIVSPDARSLLLAGHTSKFAALLQSYLIQDNIAKAFFTLERARARSLLELLTDRHLDLTADAPTELRKQEEKFHTQRAEISNQLNELAATEENHLRYEELKFQDHKLHQQQQKLKAQIRATSPHYASLQYPQPLTLPQAQQLLEPGTLLLSYLVDETQTFLFVLAADRPPVAFMLPIGRETLQERIRQFISSLPPHQFGYDAAEMAAQSRQLYADLVGPAHARVLKAKRLVICPDGPLLTLPFGALALNSRRQPRYLGEEKPLRTILSATLATQLQQRVTTEAHPFRLLAVGDPRYYVPQDTAEREELRRLGRLFEPLPYSLKEVEMLADLFGESATIRLGAEATRSAVLTESAGADLIHIACHGQFNPRMPLHSRLALSQPETLEEVLSPHENGLLPAWEIFQKLQLRARLVTLSACQTGQGQEVQGEGLIGLARAFQYAGARNLVVTLWKTADESTFVFMQAFYKAFQEGVALDEALRQGIQALRKHARWKHPYYWAAFLLIGNAD